MKMQIKRIESGEWLVTRNGNPDTNRYAFCASDQRQAAAEDQLAFLDARRITVSAENDTDCVSETNLYACMPDDLLREFQNGGVRVENEAHPRHAELTGRQIPDMVPCPKGRRCRLHLAALGDVGSTLLIGLKLLGGDVIREIGIYDLNPALAQRWEMELNQIAYPYQAGLPEVRIITEEELFDCDVFVFAASASVPPVGSGVADVRMAQFSANRKIIRIYAKKAREAHFKGLFAVVSDPVDLLARTAFDESNRNESGELDFRGLLAEQIQGYGLGVMNARAAYYAKKDAAEKEIPCRYLTEGRAYGPHGEGLVIANSIRDYEEAESASLTERALHANLEVRALGYKPYAAPALSSGALSILLTLRGEWHYGSVSLGGSWIGVRNRYTGYGIETEERELPDELFEKIRRAEAILTDAWEKRE